MRNRLEWHMYHVAHATLVQWIDFVTEEARLTFTKTRHLDAFRCRYIFACLNISLVSSDTISTNQNESLWTN